MLLPDVNVLIYAHRTDSSDDHADYAEWLTGVATGREPFALSTLGLAGVVRIVANPRIFGRPSTHDEVFGFIAELVLRPTARVVHPGAAAPRDLRGSLPPLRSNRQAGGQCPARRRGRGARMHPRDHRRGPRPLRRPPLAASIEEWLRGGLARTMPVPTDEVGSVPAPVPVPVPERQRGPRIARRSNRMG
jgi:hypothetical protein